MNWRGWGDLVAGAIRSTGNVARPSPSRCSIRSIVLSVWRLRRGVEWFTARVLSNNIVTV